MNTAQPTAVCRYGVVWDSGLLMAAVGDVRKMKGIILIWGLLQHFKTKNQVLKLRFA